MQNFKSSTTTVIELCFFYEDEEEDEESIFYMYILHTSCDIFVQFFGMQLLFYMFSTLISLGDRLS